MAWLPEALPDEVTPLWTAKLPNMGHGGVAVAEGVCVVGMRDLADEEDVFDAFDAETGERLWRHSYPAPGSLDYGNASRATPLIRDGVVYLFGALGHLSALDVTTGDLLWEKDLAQEYDTPELAWGLAGTPLLVGDLLVVQPGGRKACLVGLDAATGDERWKTAGGKPSHSSFIHWQANDAGFVIGSMPRTWRPSMCNQDGRSGSSLPNSPGLQRSDAGASQRPAVVRRHREQWSPVDRTACRLRVSEDEPGRVR